MDIERIRELVELLQGTDIRRLEVKWEGGQIDVERELGAGQVTMMAAPPQQLAHGAHPTPPPAAGPPITHVSLPVTAAVPAVPAAAPQRTGEVVTSPFVGTFYRAASPDAKPFAQIGARVHKGDTLCIVEAMKLMNEIESEFSGVVREILVDNEAAVQFGQELFVIEPD